MQTHLGPHHQQPRHAYEFLLGRQDRRIADYTLRARRNSTKVPSGSRPGGGDKARSSLIAR
jgi:hypothetical protein